MATRKSRMFRKGTLANANNRISSQYRKTEIYGIVSKPEMPRVGMGLSSDRIITSLAQVNGEVIEIKSLVADKIMRNGEPCLLSRITKLTYTQSPVSTGGKVIKFQKPGSYRR